MGTTVLKATRDTDLYLLWSTVVEAPTFIGNRSEVAAHLWQEYRREHPHCQPHPDYGPNGRIARAEKFGSSMIAPAEWGAWDCGGLIVEQRGVLPRTSLAAFAEAYAHDDLDAAYALLQPFEGA